jgi:hypothetical protein
MVSSAKCAMHRGIKLTFFALGRVVLASHGTMIGYWVREARLRMSEEGRRRWRMFDE